MKALKDIIKKKERPAGRMLNHKKVIGLGACVVALSLATPTGVYAYESVQFHAQKEALATELRDNIKDDVSNYVKGTVVKDTVLASGDTGSATSGIVTKGVTTTSAASEEIADEVAAILTEEYISRMESDMLTDLYGQIDTIVDTKLSVVPNYTDEDIDSIAEAVKSIITVDLVNYKEELTLKYQELQGLYTMLNDRLSLAEVNFTTLSNDVALLKATYDAKFALLEATDMNLQAQITILKAQNTAINNQYATMQSTLALQKKDMEGIRAELQTRIDTLNTSSAKGDVELKNVLIEVQNELNKTMAVEDAKIYDNAVAIIELTDKITNMDAGLQGAIDVLNRQAGTDTTDLYAALLALQSSLQESDNTFSGAVNSERQQRLDAVNELIALIESLRDSTTATDSDLYLTIERKSRSLASDLSKTSADIKTEYTTLITNTNTVLSERIDSVNEDLANSIKDTDEKLTSNLSATESKLSTSIDNTKAELTAYIDVEQLETKEEIKFAVTSLQNEISDLQAQIIDLQAQITKLKEDDIKQLKSDKLNIVDSPDYKYSDGPDGTTLRIRIPNSNPNLLTDTPSSTGP